MLQQSLVIFALLMAAAVGPAQANDLNQLLKQIEAQSQAAQAENRQREAEFLSDKRQQQALYNASRKELRRQEKRSEQLKTSYESNQQKIAELEKALDEKTGDMGELFGVVRQVAGETRAQFDASMVSAQFPERLELIESLATSKSLPTAPELEAFWLALTREMVEGGKVVQFEAQVVSADGEKNLQDVTRVGLFNAVSEGHYLNYLSSTHEFAELGRQPSDRYLETVTQFESAEVQYANLAIDPSRGVILSLLVQSPDVQERVAQGGVVGMIIIALGLLGLLIFLVRYLVLWIQEAKIKRQLRSEAISENNPLGRLLKIHQQNQALDTESLELRIDEEVIRSGRQLEQGISLIKLLAAVAPLLGLLGTVVGMIATFQSITLFGTGDPKLMAGGISEALVTTMLGLIVAIPLIFLHSLAHGKSRYLLKLLQEQSAGLIAQRSEQQFSKAAQE